MDSALDSTNVTEPEVRTKNAFSSYISELMRLTDVDASELATETGLSRELINRVIGGHALPEADDQAELIEYIMSHRNFD